MSPSPPKKWQTIGLMITRHVHRGQVTTYSDLSEALNGHGRGARAIGTMIKTWATNDARNCSHRVVNDDGTLPIVDVHERLLKEGVAFDAEGKVILEKHRASLPAYGSEAS
jgi:alkylated DNA nucleotide flippase Atl1